MMTEPLSWERWRKVYLNKKNKKRASLEGGDYETYIL